MAFISINLFKSNKSNLFWNKCKCKFAQVNITETARRLKIYRYCAERLTIKVKRVAELK